MTKATLFYLGATLKLTSVSFRNHLIFLTIVMAGNTAFGQDLLNKGIASLPSGTVTILSETNYNLGFRMCATLEDYESSGSWCYSLPEKIARTTDYCVLFTGSSVLMIH